jgi:hypothetical protein
MIAITLPDKAARSLLANKLAEYTEKLTPELENILSAKALTTAGHWTEHS